MPQLSTKLLNNHPSHDYFILDNQINTSNTSQLSVIFNNAVVKGNLNTNQKTTTTLQKLNEEAIRTFNGRQISIKSPITFTDNLIVDHLSMKFDVDDFVQRSKQLNRTSNLFGENVRKRFAKHLFIDNNVIVKSDDGINVAIKHLNDNPSLESSLNSLISFDRWKEIPGIVVFDGNLDAEDITIAKFVDNSNHSNKTYDLNNVLSNIFNLRENRIRLLEVNGDVRFNSNSNEPQLDSLNIDKLNGLDLTKYLADIVSKEDIDRETPIIIGGRKIFSSNVNVPSVKTTAFNEKLFTNNWIENAFRHQRNGEKTQQFVNGFHWYLEKVTADAAQIQKINNIRMAAENDEPSDIIVINNNLNDKITIKSDVSFSSAITIDSNAELTSTDVRPCNASALFEETVNLAQMNLKLLNISGNVNINDVNSSPPRASLLHFFEYAMLKDSDQKVDKDVVFRFNPSHRVTFNHIHVDTESDSIVPQTLINDINLVDISNDAVTKSSPESISIRGRKDFNNNNIICEGSETKITGDFIVGSINGIRIQELNDSLIFQNNGEILIANDKKLMFVEPLTTNAMSVAPNQTINGVLVEDIFFVYQPRPKQQSPAIIFDRINQLHSHRLHAKQKIYVNVTNEMSLKFLIENRVKLFDHSAAQDAKQMIEGRLTFDDLVVTGDETHIDQINDVVCDEIVLSHSTEKQQITGFKEIVGDQSTLLITRPFHTWRINDIDFVPVFTKTIFLDQNQTIDELAIRNPFQVDAPNAAIIKEKLNGVSHDTASNEKQNP